MKKIDQFTRKYSLQKTLRFSLIPQGETLEHIRIKQYLEEDKKRAEDYKKVKKIIDRYHRKLIDEVLQNVQLPDLEEYAELYFAREKTDDQKDRMEKLESKYRGILSGDKRKGGAFCGHPDYELLFKKELLSQLVPQLDLTAEEKRLVQSFSSFFTYFRGFNSNRENVYSPDAKATAIGHRCIHENLPRYLDNTRTFTVVKTGLPAEKLEELRTWAFEELGVSLEDLFMPGHFSFVLTQQGINIYNKVLGGYTGKRDSDNVQGLNVLINLYNQNTEKKVRLPRLKPLYKQILSERANRSDIPEEFQTDDEVYTAVDACFSKTPNKTGLLDHMGSLEKLFLSLREFDPAGVFVDPAGITDYAGKALHGWFMIRDAWYARYDETKQGKHNSKYEENREKAWKQVKCLSLKELAELTDRAAKDGGMTAVDPVQYYADAMRDKLAEVRAKAEQYRTAARAERLQEKREAEIAPLKELLDSVKAVESLIRPFMGTEQGSLGDAAFYGELTPVWDALREYDPLYNEIRNYVTKKPFEMEEYKKYKLTFDCSTLLDGWDINKEKDDLAVLLMRGGGYYLGIMDKRGKKAFENVPAANGEDCYQKMQYKQLPGPNKMLPKVFFSKSRIGEFAPSAEVMRIYKAGTFKKGTTFSLSDCHTLIDFYKSAISRHPDWSQFGFQFSPTESYQDVSGFFQEISEQGYKLSFRPIPASYVDELTRKGLLYLFQIYCKDFSPQSKGKPNLHTQYFRMLFDERNLAEIVYKLNGEAEMFFRKASLKSEKPTHPADRPIENKNPEWRTKRPVSTFPYDLYKDRRYTRDQFSLHVPIAMNAGKPKRYLLDREVLGTLAESSGTNVIGIDRGERNLLYYCVIDSNAEILEQGSMNVIGDDDQVQTNYQTLLTERGIDNKAARQNWSAVKGIKDLKAGYMSQVVHKLTALMVKYDAVIALEDLNSGFKNSRQKIDRQVYQRFENAMIDKLSYLVTDKAGKNDPTLPGGLLQPYQLASKDSKSKQQNGFIFYVPAWLTSKLDPVTGFADLLHPRYTNAKEAQDYIKKLDAVRFVPEEDLFEIDVDYEEFPNTASSFRKKWTFCSYGTRIRRSKDRASGKWIAEEVQLTAEYRKLFNEAQIDIMGDIKQQLQQHEDKKTLESFIDLLALTLQMRNSDGDLDYIISPVRGADGRFYDSREYEGVADARLPRDADANGAYNIARKALWTIQHMDKTSFKLPVMTKAQWLEYAQRHE